MPSNEERVRQLLRTHGLHLSKACDLLRPAGWSLAAIWACRVHRYEANDCFDRAGTLAASRQRRQKRCAQRIAKSSGELLWRLAFHIEFLLSSDGRPRHSAHEHLRDELPVVQYRHPVQEDDLLIG